MSTVNIQTPTGRANPWVVEEQDDAGRDAHGESHAVRGSGSRYGLDVALARAMDRYAA